MTRCVASLRLWRGDTFLQRGVPIEPPPSRREVVTTDTSPSWTLATPWYTGQLVPTVGGISYQLPVGNTLHPETFQAGTLRGTDSGKDR